MATQSINVVDLDGDNGFRLIGAQGSGFSGTRVSNAGDVNDDGLDDVIISGASLSASYVVFGKADGFDATLNLSDLDGSNGFSLEGGASSISNAGDINGDGFDDLILGVSLGIRDYYGGDAGGNSYVVFGKADGFDATLNLSGLDGSNGFRLDGASAYDKAGQVSNAGDVNGDGFDDVIIGAPGADPNGSNSGSSYVVFGKASGFDTTMNLSSLDGNNGFRLDGASAYDENEVSNAGDINGDGFDDLIIGNDVADLNGRDSGSSYVIFGKATGFDAAMNLSDLDGRNGFRLDGATINDRSGHSVSSAGDVNGDGFDDLIIGVPFANPEGVLTGSSYVVFGKASGFDAAMSLSGLDGNNNGFRIDGPELTAFDGSVNDRPLGGSVSGAGDVNGDGFDDLIVNAPNSDSNGDDSGPGYVIFGRSEFTDGGVDFPAPPEVRPTTTSINLSSLDGSNGFRLSGGNNRYYLDAISLSSAGDMNGDGFDDMGIGLVFEKYYHGSYVVFGKASGFDATIDLNGLDGKNGFGISGTNQSFVEGVGDMNGDGFDDAALVTGSAGYYSFYSSAYIIFGKSGDFNPGLDPSSLDGNTGFRIDGVSNDNFTGRSFSGAGDINGDGFDDVIIGSEFAPFQYNDEASYVVFGKSSGFNAVVDVSELNGNNGFRIDGLVESVSNAGDINGDGIDDVIVDGSIVFGKSSGFDATINLSDLDGTNGFRFDGPVKSASSAGDINGDGIDDVIIGSNIVFGKSSGFEATMNLSDLDGDNGFRLDRIGGSAFVDDGLRGAGDVNGDGFDDLIVGSFSSSYVMFGKASGFDATVKLFELNSSNSVRFDGASSWVSGAGDVNGDGFDDFMIADPGADPGEDTAYVIFGKNQFTGTVTYVGIPENNDVFTGTAAAERFDPSDGNDLLIGGGGADVIYGGLDDDTIRVPDLGFQLVDGGSGNDTLGLDGSGINLDLANAGDKVIGIETIDLGSAGDNMLTLTLQDVLNLSDTTDTLIVKGDAGDRVTGLSSGWVDNGIQGGFHVFTQGNAELRTADAVDTDFIANRNVSVSALDGANGFRLNGAGRSVSNAGDVNGDGIDDVIVGAFRFDGSDYVGSSYVVFGKDSGFDAVMNLSDLDGGNGFRLDEATEHGGAGKSVSNAGDVNGDGFDDVIITATGIGSSYVVFGKASGFSATMNLSGLDGSDGFRLNGAADSASGAGDVNGDGFDDLIVGTVYAGPSDRYSYGSSYVVFGKVTGFNATMNVSDLDGSNGFRLDGVEIFEHLGASVSNAGDVNGDGYDDVIVGNSLNSNSDSGYVVFGKASGFDAAMSVSDLNGSNGFKLEGNGFFSRPVSVSTAGDFNGDGFDDLIIGQSSDSSYAPGASYVMFGKASGFSAKTSLSELEGVNGFRIDGSAGDLLGFSVSSAGDMNDDGFGDLLIGAPDVNSSYVIFGHSSFVDEVDFPGTPGDDIFTGTSAAESFEGGEGNDRMIGRGGADSFDGGAGNDYIRILGADFERVDGGLGTDTLGLAGGNFNLNLSSVIDKIHGIETISLYGVGDNTLTLAAQDVLDLSDSTDTLKIKGNTGDGVTGLSSGWTDGGVHGNFHTYTQGEAVLLIGIHVATDFPVI